MDPAATLSRSGIGLTICPNGGLQLASSSSSSSSNSSNSPRLVISCKKSSNDPIRFHPFYNHPYAGQGIGIPIHALDSGDYADDGDKNKLATSSELTPFLSQDMAMGLVLRAAVGTGWTTGSGLEGPSFPVVKENTADQIEQQQQQKWPHLSNSPRRRMRVAFTCNVCGERTVRAINPHAYTDGTVFVQCKGCDVFHKLVDNLNLFYEWDGRLFNYNDKPIGKIFDYLHSDELP